MTMLDVFNDSAFGVVSLTDSINKVKFVPSRLGGMGLFQPSGVATTSVAIEERDGVLSLIAPTPRGGPGKVLDKNYRTARNLALRHFEINDAIYAEEVQGVRAWGSETAVEMVSAKVAERLAIHTQSLEATEEYARVGAVKGIITYADSTTTSLFTEFGVSAQSEVDFDLDNASPASGALRKKCASVVRTIAEALDGVPMTGVHALCSSAFFDDLVAHAEVRDTYLGYQAAQDLRAGYAYGGFQFGGIFFEEYRGAVGGTSFIEADKAYLFPVGVPGLFRSYYGPADYIETVNTMGQPRYAKQYAMANGKGVYLDTQTNVLHICTRPRALVKAKRT